ncbi:hypothetical protein [Brooklawnia cerclae]|uniref:Uncharacterized protein n=1 Tax=Brooklawnia cerclae TaxID=349934 RepID=A0ABX0SEA9_9ACTN|nr:hypothetical protein [Brooklawnia cerclae]NIH56732.1 hypothetical protein [Brooklawnia cerclae]
MRDIARCSALPIGAFAPEAAPVLVAGLLALAVAVLVIDSARGT